MAYFIKHTNTYSKSFKLSNDNRKTRTHSMKTIQMTDKTILSIHTLPVDLVYRILDNLDEEILFFIMLLLN